eukprot:TRINITY_DN62765_c0_g1_i1.p1 TRINITY_DN62765_c0_g1~~TRINITY_DN62765_c0_g1_i1.p1  ORF type:complete len:326 (-),score=89.24 TRINITY_DN62765_c0_g1_i1:136-1059(-)
MDDAAYRVEPAKSGRSTCKISKEIIEKGELRFGSLVDMGGHGTYHWRKLAYISSKQVEGVEEKLGGVENVGGFADLSPADQKLFRKAIDSSIKVGKAKAKAKDKVLADKAKAKAAKVKAKAKALESKLKAKAKAAAAKTKAMSAKEKAKAAMDARKAKAKAKAKGKASKRAEEAEGTPPCPPDELSLEEQHAFLDKAKEYKFKEVRKLILQNPAYVNVQPAGRWSALHQAAEWGDVSEVKWLLTHDADINVKTKDGKTPLEVAHEDCEQLLKDEAEKKVTEREPAESNVLPPSKRGRSAGDTPDMED